MRKAKLVRKHKRVILIPPYIPSFPYLLKKKSYLKVLKRHERLPIPWFTPQMFTSARVGQARVRGLELGPGFPRGGSTQAPESSPFSCFPGVHEQESEKGVAWDLDPGTLKWDTLPKCPPLPLVAWDNWPSLKSGNIGKFNATTSWMSESKTQLDKLLLVRGKHPRPLWKSILAITAKVCTCSPGIPLPDT